MRFWISDFAPVSVMLETEGKTGTLVRRLVQVLITIGAGVTVDQTRNGRHLGTGSNPCDIQPGKES